jgi:hypothetical protein
MLANFDSTAVVVEGGGGGGPNLPRFLLSTKSLLFQIV